MNIDNGFITLWNDLSSDEKESGRWVKLGEGEFARAEAIDRNERPQRLNEIFKAFEPKKYGE